MNISFDKELVGPWVFHRIGKVWGAEGREAIGVVDDEQVYGGVVFEDYTKVAIQVHIALAHPHVPIRKLLVTAAMYAYNQLGVDKILAMVKSANDESINFITKIGFRPEAMVVDVFPDGDLLIFSMTRSQCRFLPRQKEAA